MDPRIKYRLFPLVTLIAVALACSTSPAVTQPPAAAPASTASTVAPAATLPPTEAPPTVAPTATSIPKFFTEDFDKDFADWSLFLTNGDKAKLDLNTENGMLVFNITGRQLWAYLTYDAQTYDNVRIDARVENRGDNQNNISILCRYDKDRGWYEFNVGNDGLYSILYGKSTPEKKLSYTTIHEGGSNKIKQGLAVNDYSVICKDSTLSLYINGVETRTVQETHFGLREGKIAISASSFQRFPVIIAFDQVKLSQP
jgi:hypothetical protein